MSDKASVETSVEDRTAFPTVNQGRVKPPKHPVGPISIKMRQPAPRLTDWANKVAAMWLSGWDGSTSRNQLSPLIGKGANMRCPDLLKLLFTTRTWNILYQQGVLQGSIRPRIWSTAKLSLQVNRYKFPTPVPRTLVRSIEILLSQNQPVFTLPHAEFSVESRLVFDLPQYA